MATPSQRWALGLSAVLTELNQGYHHELGGWGAGEHTAGWCRKVLANSWGVSDADTFRQMTTWLWNEGHRAECTAVLQGLGPDPKKDDDKQALVRANRKLLGGPSLLAWDLGRFVAVVGWGKWAGYVAEDQAWAMLHGAATWAQRSFKSWREYGRHYEFGRYYWSMEDDPRIEAIIEKLKTDPKSPWVQLAWDMPLGPAPVVVAPQKRRIKRTVCRACGAPKQLPPKTGWVYCDRCGTLADWDFRTACEGGSALPGPAYEAIAARLAPQLDAARAAGDYNRCLTLQRDLFTSWVEHCPKAVPPRAGEPEYRAAYVDYLAHAAAATDLDGEWQMLAIVVRGAMKGIMFEGDPRRQRVKGAGFWPLYEAVRRQTERGMRVYEEAGVLERHPDAAPADLQLQLTWSVFAQGWLPFLQDADAAQLLEKTGLGGDYIELPDVRTGTRHCGGCGGEITIVEGAQRVVCEACGHRVEVGVDEIPCGQCGGMISFPEGKARVACPFCEAMVARI
jgi:DNA-directed RNA polymerase subunit RPC12/RpoP